MLDLVAPLITKKRSKHKKSHGMTKNSMTKGEYSKTEKENGSNIKYRTSGSHTSGSKIDTIQCLG